MPQPQFSNAFRDLLTELLAWRRDVRRFTARPVDPALLDALLDCACLAPSVGNSQPWRFVLVQSPSLKQDVYDAFRDANAQAATLYSDNRCELYNSLKLEGLKMAPVHLAVCCDETTPQGHGLGRQTMPETLAYSTVCAIHTLWLAARAYGLGMGWLSILDPKRVGQLLDIPPQWKLAAYLCLGYAESEGVEPELAKAGWQQREMACRVLHVR